MAVNLFLPATLTIFLSLLLVPSINGEGVNDIDGDIVFATSHYFIIPVLRGFGGGLRLGTKNDSNLCPLYVKQSNNEVDFGLPTKFHPRNSKQGFVSSSTNLHIEFRAFTTCIQSTAWRLAPDEETGRLYVATGGESSWFKIEKVESYGNVDDYKIVYCPGGDDVVCGDVGVFVEGERRLLGLSDKPLLVRFKKAFQEE